MKEEYRRHFFIKFAVAACLTVCENLLNLPSTLHYR
jgi:hypothetical protein